MSCQINVQKRVRLVLVIALLLVLSSCGARTEYGAAKISSTPEGAEVVNLKDGSHLGVTPVKVSFTGEADTAEFVTIQLRKPGYVDRITTFWLNRRHETPLAADDNAIDIHVNLEKKANN